MVRVAAAEEVEVEAVIAVIAVHETTQADVVVPLIDTVRLGKRVYTPCPLAQILIPLLAIPIRRSTSLGAAMMASLK